jgi:hypothetical protein
MDALAAFPATFAATVEDCVAENLKTYGKSLGDRASGRHSLQLIRPHQRQAPPAT